MRTVIFLCEHKDEGTFGFVLNKKFPKTLSDLVPDLDEYKIPVYYGGPVQKIRCTPAPVSPTRSPEVKKGCREFIGRELKSLYDPY